MRYLAQQCFGNLNLFGDLSNNLSPIFKETLDEAIRELSGQKQVGSMDNELLQSNLKIAVE